MKTTEVEKKANEHSDNPTSSSMWTSTSNRRKESRFYRTNTRKLSLISSGVEGREAKKICRVCGDKAFSYNFNVISCESCKAFFRRNANKQKAIRCPFNNSCIITKLSRRFCQRCRLQKCFDVGMKKEWIMSEKARLEKRQRIIANRERRAAESGLLCSDKQETSSDFEETNTFNIERPLSLLLDDSSRLSSDTLTTFAPFASFSSNYEDHDAHRAEDSGTTSNFDLPNLQNTDSLSTVFPPTSFSPNSSPVTTNTLIKTPLQASSPLTFSTPQDCGIATQQVQLSTQIQRAAEIEQYIQQHSTTQTVLQPFSNGLPQSVSEASSETVTVPRQTLMKLIQQSTTSQHQVPLPPGHENMGVPPKCRCVCICGRYRPGSLVVDEVMKEILANPLCQSRPDSPKSQCEEKQNNEVDEANTVMLQTYDLPNTAYNLQNEKDSVQSTKSLNTYAQSNSNKSSLKHRKSSLLEEELDSVRVDPDCCLMTSADQDRLSEVISAFSTWSESNVEITEGKWIDNRCNTIYDLLNLVDKAVHKMIKMTKRITTFQKMEHHDQIHLLKGACLEYIILRSAFCYVPSKQCWQNPESSLGSFASVDVLQKFPENLLNHFIRFYSLFKSEFRTNKYVMSLIGSLILFNPDTKNLKNPSAVNDEQIQYRKVLKRLLYTLCGQDQRRTNSELTQLLKNIYELKKLAEKVQRIIVGIDAKKLQPLLLEMLS